MEGSQSGWITIKSPFYNKAHCHWLNTIKKHPFKKSSQNIPKTVLEFTPKKLN
jgi:hypothetical protein